MKILSAIQMYEADKATIRNLPISSIDLMEKAAGECVAWITRKYSDSSKHVHVVCGMGNNGGDGLVISRKLINSGFKVSTYLINFSKKRSPDFISNLERLLHLDKNIVEINKSDDFPEIPNDDLIIDAIFGIGLTRTPKDLVKEVIVKINQSEALTVSIDFPSGLFSETSVIDDEAVIRSDFCLTFQNPKLAFLMPENNCYIDKWEVLDINLDQNFIDSLESSYGIISKNDILENYKPRSRFSHKGTFGHSLLIGGSFGKIGALILASRAAMKVGSGLVSSYIPKCGYISMQTANPEVMVEVDDQNYLQFFNFKTKPDAIGIGPGMGTHLKTKSGFVEFLKINKLPIVIDADGLNIISEHEDLLDLIPADSILTPHPKEFERLVGTWKDDYEKLEKQLRFSQYHNCILILKGAYTTIAYKNKIQFNITGNPALATAGSGDVLTGMITGLLAQGYEPIHAAIIGVYVHGRSADLAIEDDQSMESFTASDGIQHLDKVFKEIH